MFVHQNASDDFSLVIVKTAIQRQPMPTRFLLAKSQRIEKIILTTLGFVNDGEGHYYSYGQVHHMLVMVMVL